MTAETWVIDQVTKVDSHEGWHWAISMVMPSGVKMLHTIPPDAFEWRAAEYGLDPETEFDTILDIILHEPYIPNPEIYRNHEQDAAKKAGLTSPAPHDQGAYISAGDPVPTVLYNAESTDKAREAMLLRVEHIKATRVKIVSPAQASPKSRSLAASKVEDPLDAIRADKQIDDERLARKRDLVASVKQISKPKKSAAMRTMSMTPQAPRPASRPFAPMGKKLPFDPSLEKKEES